MTNQEAVPRPPVVLGIVLGGMPEFNFVTSMLNSEGDLTVFVSRPVAAAPALVVLAGWQVIATVTMEGEWDPADPIGEAVWMQRLADRTGRPAAHVAQAWLAAPLKTSLTA